MTELQKVEISKTDKVGCAFIQIGNSIMELDNRFADANGDIKIQTFDKALEAFTLLYATIKHTYACTGKEFSIKVDGVAGKLLELILELLDEKNPKA
jgi:hypothetical protein